MGIVRKTVGAHVGLGVHTRFASFFSPARSPKKVCSLHTDTMALKSATRLQRAAARSEALVAALPASVRASTVVASAMRQAFSSAKPAGLTKSVSARKPASGRALSVKVSAVNGSGLKVDLRGKA